jgi:hypothetical protein
LVVIVAAVAVRLRRFFGPVFQGEEVLGIAPAPGQARHHLVAPVLGADGTAPVSLGSQVAAHAASGASTYEGLTPADGGPLGALLVRQLLDGEAAVGSGILGLGK